MGYYYKIASAYSLAISNVAGAIIAYGWYRRETWRNSDLTETKVDIDEAGIGMSADGD